MTGFKFFNNGWQDPPIDAPNRPLMDNEMVIRYYNDGDFRVILYTRVIAWARGQHAFADNWTEQVFEGTMERFFYNRLEIPVISSIEAMVDDGATFYEEDAEYMSVINFDFPVRIKYFQYESI